MKKYFKRTIWQRAFFYLLPSSDARIRYLKKHHVFAEMGEDCFYQCREIPVEPRLVKIHNNVAIAANVHIVPHDVIHIMARKLPGGVLIRSIWGALKSWITVFLDLIALYSQM